MNGAFRFSFLIELTKKLISMVDVLIILGISPTFYH
ncbi:hypothetical protein CLW00_108199 [Mongoliibacter ruber]|uniref:Uncharacterized protein n=1 Tax=Mongoliibacter ruber TaxID=1750599 RepID=A0A2T0WJ22_9BACT|nr:hypothetical protein CLW00_108199 [Mongoliibacter ruber]